MILRASSPLKNRACGLLPPAMPARLSWWPEYNIPTILQCPTLSLEYRERWEPSCGILPSETELSRSFAGFAAFSRLSSTNAGERLRRRASWVAATVSAVVAVVVTVAFGVPVLEIFRIPTNLFEPPYLAPPSCGQSAFALGPLQWDALSLRCGRTYLEGRPRTDSPVLPYTGMSEQPRSGTVHKAAVAFKSFAESRRPL